jgi:hypothetical protein
MTYTRTVTVPFVSVAAIEALRTAAGPLACFVQAPLIATGKQASTYATKLVREELLFSGTQSECVNRVTAAELTADGTEWVVTISIFD